MQMHCRSRARACRYCTALANATRRKMRKGSRQRRRSLKAVARWKWQKDKRPSVARTAMTRARCKVHRSLGARPLSSASSDLPYRLIQLSLFAKLHLSIPRSNHAIPPCCWRNIAASIRCVPTQRAQRETSKCRDIDRASFSGKQTFSWHLLGIRLAAPSDTRFHSNSRRAITAEFFFSSFSSRELFDALLSRYVTTEVHLSWSRH